MAVPQGRNSAGASSIYSVDSLQMWIRRNTIHDFEMLDEPPFWENNRALYSALMSVQLIADFMNDYKATTECRTNFVKMVQYFSRFVKNHRYHSNWSNKKFKNKAKAKIHEKNYNIHSYEFYLEKQSYYSSYLRKKARKATSLGTFSVF